MKKLYLVGGPMGVGKPAACRILKEKLDHSVFLDGDWCWDMSPFLMTEETKAMVLDNICFLLNRFIRCSSIDHIIFCWVMHDQKVIDEIISRLDAEECAVYPLSLICREEILKRRLEKDIAAGKRKEDVVARSLERASHYQNLKTEKLDTSELTPEQTACRMIEMTAQEG